MNAERLTYLFNKYYDKSCTPAERQEFLDTLREGENDPAISELIEAVLHNTKGELKMDEEAASGILQSILQADKVQQPAVVRPMRRRYLSGVAAAAVILLGLSIGGYFIFYHKKPATEIAQAKVQDVQPPKVAKAVITLASGQQIILDSMGNGTLATQGNVTIIKKEDGEIAYIGSPGSSPSGEAEVGYNTLSNPRGSRVISLTLADGSKVWLNAESSLTYPTAFTGDERKVTITGEVYFEVAHNARMPFVVQKNEVSVQVLGTHFDVNAYGDEMALKATLLEGSVKVTRAGLSRVITPGQQAKVTANGDIQVANVNPEKVMAWKNQLFWFENEDIQTIMREVARWYDADIIFKGEVTTHYGFVLQRNLPVSKLLKVLELTGGVHFTIEGNKITVER